MPESSGKQLAATMDDSSATALNAVAAQAVASSFAPGTVRHFTMPRDSVFMACARVLGVVIDLASERVVKL